MKISCDVISDLIPLVNDGVASDESKILVREHCSECENCAKQLNEEADDRTKNDKIIKAIKKSIYSTQLIFIIVGALIGIGFTYSNNMFYNFLIMPIIGALSFVTLKRKWFIPLIIVFLGAYIWQSAKFIPKLILNKEPWWTALSSSFWICAIYALLMLVGVLITFLLKYAFKGKIYE